MGRAEYDQLVRDGVPGAGKQEINPDTGLPTGRLIRERIPVQITAPAMNRVPWLNRRTGVTEMVPKGIDPGFDTNPGARYRLVTNLRVLKDRLASVDEDVAQAVVRSWAEGPSLALWLEKPFEAVPIAVVREAQAAAVQAKTRVVMLSADTLEKQQREHPELAASEYTKIAKVVSQGVAVQDSPRSMRFVLDEADGYVGVVKSTLTGLGLFLTSYRRLSRDAVTRDRELARLLGQRK